jgi:long-chain acyl-CoA synthetase
MKQVKPTIMLTVPLIIEKIFKSKILPTFQKNSFIRFLYSVPPVRKLLHKVAASKLYKSFGGELIFFGIGGAKLDPTVERFLKEGKFPYAIGYGLTETSPMLAGAVGKNTRVGTTGLAMEGVQLRIADIDPVTREGELQAKGPNVNDGLLQSARNHQRSIYRRRMVQNRRPGLLRQIQFPLHQSRIKTMIVGASGENIYPERLNRSSIKCVTTRIAGGRKERKTGGHDSF